MTDLITFRFLPMQPLSSAWSRPLYLAHWMRRGISSRRKIIF